MTARPFLVYPTSSGPGLFLGPTETLLMEQLWSNSPQTARALARSVTPGRRLALTTIITVLKRLLGKGLVTRTRVGRSFLFSPALDRRTFLVQQSELLKACLSRCR